MAPCSESKSITRCSQVSKEDATPELTSSIAGVILTLMANLRHCFLADQPDATAHIADFAASLLDSAAASQSGGFGHVTGARTMFASSLQVVLKGLIEYLVGSSE